MTNIAEMLTPEEREVLAALKAHAEVNALPEKQPKKPKPPARPELEACTCGAKHGFTTLPGSTLAVCADCFKPTTMALQMLGKAYTEALPEPLVEEPHVTAEEIDLPDEATGLPPVTTINGVEVDLRSEAMHDTACADCNTPLLVQVAPKGVDLEVLTSQPRVAVCEPCGRERVKGKRGVLIHHAPANPEPVKKPKAKKAKKKPKEAPTLDLTKFSNAELAQVAVEAREHMVAEQAAALPKKRKKAKKKEAKRVAKDEALKQAQRKERRSRLLPAFTVKGKDVPALDLRDITDLNEAVSAKQRSPYNKALHALGMALLDRETTTYQVLLGVHTDLLTMAEQSVTPEPKPKKAKKQRLVADLDADAKAKVEAFAKVKGVAYDEARTHLAGLGLI